MGEEGIHLGTAHLARMPQPVKAQIVARLQQLAMALDQSGWLGYWGHGWLLDAP